METETIIFTKEDLNTVLEALDRLSAGHFAKEQNKFDIAKTRIYFQLRK